MTRGINPVALRPGRDFDEQQALAAMVRTKVATERFSLLYWLTAATLVVGGAALGWHLASRAPVYCTTPLYETLPTGTTWVRCTENGRELFLLTPREMFDGTSPQK